LNLVPVLSVEAKGFKELLVFAILPLATGLLDGFKTRRLEIFFFSRCYNFEDLILFLVFLFALFSQVDSVVQKISIDWISQLEPPVGLSVAEVILQNLDEIIRLLVKPLSVNLFRAPQDLNTSPIALDKGQLIEWLLEVNSSPLATPVGVVLQRHVVVFFQRLEPVLAL